MALSARNEGFELAVAIFAVGAVANFALCAGAVQRPRLKIFFSHGQISLKNLFAYLANTS